MSAIRTDQTYGKLVDVVNKSVIWTKTVSQESYMVFAK